jgi:hypothetical protein
LAVPVLPAAYALWVELEHFALPYLGPRIGENEAVFLVMIVVLFLTLVGSMLLWKLIEMLGKKLFRK